jgi:hypothetical protein
MRAEIIKNRKPSMKGEFHDLPSEFLDKIGQDRVVRLYMQENIEVGCQRVVHDRIISDTVKNRNMELGEKLKMLELKLFEEAERQQIDTKKIRLDIKKDFKILEPLRHSARSLIPK